MKNKLFYLIIIGVLFSFSACIENEKMKVKGAKVEFDAAVYNTLPVGINFPIVARVPAYGRATVTADAAITRTSGVVNFHVNLVGAQRSTDQVIDVSVVTDAVGTEVMATEGVNFTVPATVTIPAGESVGVLPVTIINTGAGTGTVVFVLQLDGNEKIGPSENYKKIGVRVALP